jgi:hypothetical protein
MNTYNISVKGVKVLGELSPDDIQDNLKLIRGLVWTSGGNDKDIVVSLNKDEQPLQ